jgi:SAM-dependent methyltransferase
LGINHLAQGDIQALPYKDAAFDAVVSMDVIVHMPLGDERRPMAEFHRVLKPGGFLALRASALDILKSHHSIHAMERQRFTRSRLMQLAEDTGFKVLRCTYANSLLLPVALLKFRVIEPLFGGDPESGVRPVSPWLDKLLYGPLAVESKLLPAGVNLPLGQSLILLAERR